MTNKELRQAAIEVLVKAFNGDGSISAYVVQAAVSILVSPVLKDPEPVKT